MTPKKPSQSAKRSAWLASLKPGDSVYLWQSWYGWSTAKVEAFSDYHRNVSKAEIRVLPDGHVTYMRSLLPRGSGVSCVKSQLSQAIFPNDDSTAKRGFELDDLRRSLRSMNWRTVTDEALERIRDVLQSQVDSEAKEPTQCAT